MYLITFILGIVAYAAYVRIREYLNKDIETRVRLFEYSNDVIRATNKLYHYFEENEKSVKLIKIVYKNPYSLFTVENSHKLIIKFKKLDKDFKIDFGF